ncbi:MAG TPA: hypothetical protein VLU94_00570 [Candidatus Nitrosotalea sp.]|nr:hypothetical protein [Candidatus Nitrosotalea sp.]
MNRHHQRGIALVITLIMLAVVTVMAVVFLGVSRRERGSVTVAADLTDAKLAADMALSRAEAAVLSRIAAQSNVFAYDLMVSTNYINPAGFQPNNSSFANVSYTYANGTPLNRDADIRQNLTNLFYDPRPPVYIPSGNGTVDFRYYLDLNRNGRFDTNGYFVAQDVGGFVTNFFVGDPEWIGIKEHPDLPHSSSNRFVARFAYLVLPAGKTLDINYSHNAARSRSVTTEGFGRNLGVGSWEINLAAFFRDLNPNYWTPAMYNYQPGAANNTGAAFSDALSILNYRYGGNFGSQRRARDVFAQVWAFNSSPADLYSDGSLMTGTALVPKADDPNLPWSGSDNTNGYVNVQELFDTNKVSPNFVNFRLLPATRNKLAFNQSTFSRLMAQLGTDSLPANRGKLNLNYDNVAADGTINPRLATNMIPWTPLRFFTNTARLILQTQYPDQFPTNTTALKIPIWELNSTNYYHAGIHRALQLVANIWEASTNRDLNGLGYPYFPTVFRPIFTNELGGSRISIIGYTNEVGTNFLARPWRDLNVPTDRARITANDNIYGVPLVIGAKKGFPNFNEFHQETMVQVTRRLKGHKATLTDTPQFHVSYEVGVSNLFGLEAWNSYTTNYPRKLKMIISDRCIYDLRDTYGSLNGKTNVYVNVTANIDAFNWKGAGQVGQFMIPMTNLFSVLPDSFFNPFTRKFITQVTPVWDTSSRFPAPDWKVVITNRVQYLLVDEQSGQHLVDFVNLDNMVTTLDIGKWLVGKSGGLGSDAQNDPSSIFWLTNRAEGRPFILDFPATLTMAGITNQVHASSSDTLDLSQWTSYSLNQIDGNQRQKSIDEMRVFLGLKPLFYVTNPPIPKLDIQVPFTPTRKLDLQMSWQVNDPLVHYHIEDLSDPAHTDTNNVVPLLPNQSPEPSNLGQLNPRYRPWGTVAQRSIENVNFAQQDPMVRFSDDWNFPTNLFPGVGWLGRVHRGTPWQTVYLKSAVEPMADWTKWSGRADTHPTNDWWLVGLFTTAPNDNAARGLLSVNQTNLAAWSAVLSGVSVLSNNLSAVSQVVPPTNFASLFVQPTSPQLLTIVSNINATRLSLTNLARLGLPEQKFRSLGHILSSPALTLSSPFLNVQSPNQAHYGINDEAYERIPQQILSLLKEDEPFVVIYAYGQSLKPADRSLVLTPGPYQGLCTNYQITGEYVTKTAIRFQEIIQPKGKPSLYKAVVESYNVLPSE